MDLDAYRQEAEAFVSALDREYYLHFSGQRQELEIEPIYERHAELVSARAVEALRAAGSRELLELAVQGHIGRETKELAAELARREASLEVTVDGRTLPFRQAPVAQANEPDPDRRAAIEAARNELTARELDPLLREAFERTRALVRELGWESVLALCEELSGIDLRALCARSEAFLADTDGAYERVVAPRVESELGFGLDRLRRSDLPALFRAPGLDRHYPAERLLDAYRETIDALGVNGRGVRLDVEERPQKSPRAFCSPVRVPDEVYLVILPHGGREDYEALFHESGHAQHYAHVDGSLPFEQRYLGDNSVTESFAFLFQHLTSDPHWLGERLGVEDPSELVAHSRASKLVFLRRYCAKLGYELELSSAAGPLDRLRDEYARRLARAVRVEWPRETWLADVDPWFYAARYLRAWALETHLRRHLRERFGERWYAQREAGALLRALWREGQRRDADELLADLTGSQLDFEPLLAELVG